MLEVALLGLVAGLGIAGIILAFRRWDARVEARHMADLERSMEGWQSGRLAALATAYPDTPSGEMAARELGRRAKIGGVI